jgi:hypothetical protein
MNFPSHIPEPELGNIPEHRYPDIIDAYRSEKWDYLITLSKEYQVYGDLNCICERNRERVRYWYHEFPERQPDSGDQTKGID